MKMRETAARMSLVSLAQQTQESSDEAHTTVLEEPKTRPRPRRNLRTDLDDRLARLSRRFDPERF